MSRKIENPKLIALSELPDSGKTYRYNNESGELTQELGDVIGSNPYSVELFLEKIGNAYQASGEIHSFEDLQCSRCGADLKHPVNLKIREILMVQPQMPRSGKSARVNHSSEMDPLAPDCVLLQKDELSVGGFIREIMVLNEPFQPLCETPCENPYLTSQPPINEESGANRNPFSVLKDLKLNS